MPEISLKDFLIEVKRQIKESEDIITPIDQKLKPTPPNPQEQREQYFVTQELEIEIAVTSNAQVKGGINLYVVQVGGEAKSQEIHRIKIKMIKQGHRFQQE